MDAYGEAVTGTVTGKREEIDAENEPTGEDSAEYATIRSGDRVRVRYLSCCPIFSRLDGRTRNVTLRAPHISVSRQRQFVAQSAAAGHCSPR
jgi:hypothetical protein